MIAELTSLVSPSHFRNYTVGKVQSTDDASPLLPTLPWPSTNAYVPFQGNRRYRRKVVVVAAAAVMGGGSPWWLIIECANAQHGGNRDWLDL